VADRLAAFECGVDDYLVKPVKVGDLVERVRLHHHPDTTRGTARLLGSVELYDDLRRRLEAGQPVAVVIAEIEGLRAFTHHYGFARGERLVGAMAELLLELTRLEPEGLAGRLGAQDFMVLVDPGRAEDFTGALQSAFSARRPSFYDPVDVLRGWIDVADRAGRIHRHRPVRLAVGVAASPGGWGESPQDGEPRALHHLDLLERAAELARYASGAGNGPVAFDRRA
jgi:GGDEF domain-containing protein